MSEIFRLVNPEQLQQIYTQLSQQDIEQFNAGYQLWNLRKKLAELQEQASTLQQQIAENAASMQQIHPSPIALATLARFQASGVNDVDLLERMLERGEEWLDRTMQRLDYCEQFHFISYDYTQWCEHALEGAYDWIDSIQQENSPSGSIEGSTEAPPDATSEALVAATEELLLQKLSAEEGEEQPETALEITIKQQALTLSTPELTSTEEVPSGSAETLSLDEPAVALPAERFEAEVNPTPDFSKELISAQEISETPPEELLEVEVHPTPNFSLEQLPFEEAAELPSSSNDALPAAENAQTTAEKSSSPGLHSVPEAEQPIIQVPEEGESAPLAADSAPVIASPQPKVEDLSTKVETNRSLKQHDWTQQSIQPQRKLPFLQRLLNALVKLITG